MIKSHVLNEISPFVSYMILEYYCPINKMESGRKYLASLINEMMKEEVPYVE